MVMAQVTWDLAGGVRALRTLNDMLCEAAFACGLQAQQAGGRDYIGVNLNNHDYWIGVSFERPQVVVFETKWRKVDPAAATRLGIEGVSEWTTGGPGHKWSRELDLASEEVLFFGRAPARQMQMLERFLQDCLSVVKQIELPKTAEASTGPEGTGHESATE